MYTGKPNCCFSHSGRSQTHIVDRGYPPWPFTHIINQQTNHPTNHPISACSAPLASWCGPQEEQPLARCGFIIKIPPNVVVCEWMKSYIFIHTFSTSVLYTLPFIINGEKISNVSLSLTPFPAQTADRNYSNLLYTIFFWSLLWLPGDFKFALSTSSFIRLLKHCIYILTILIQCTPRVHYLCADWSILSFPTTTPNYKSTWSNVIVLHCSNFLGYARAPHRMHAPISQPSRFVSPSQKSSFKKNILQTADVHSWFPSPPSVAGGQSDWLAGWVPLCNRFEKCCPKFNCYRNQNIVAI